MYPNTSFNWKNTMGRSKGILTIFLPHLRWRLTGELLVYQCLRHPSSVLHLVNIFKKPQWTNLTQISYRDSLGWGNESLHKMFLVTQPRWPPHPYKVKPLKIFFSGTKRPWPWNLICSIVNVGSTKFAQILILGFPWPTLWQGQIWFLTHLYGETFWNVHISVYCWSQICST